MIANIKGLVVVIGILVVNEFHDSWWRRRGKAAAVVTRATGINFKLPDILVSVRLKRRISEGFSKDNMTNEIFKEVGKYM